MPDGHKEGAGGADWEMKSASRANVAYERFLFLCFLFLRFPLATLATFVSDYPKSANEFRRKNG